MSQPLPNYLKTYRKKAGFSQEELATLLDSGGPDTISRYEHGKREPSIETLLAYSIALDVPVRELFRGTYQKVEQQTARRAERLAEQLPANPEDRRTRRKRKTLSRIAEQAAERAPAA